MSKLRFDGEAVDAKGFTWDAGSPPVATTEWDGEPSSTRTRGGAIPLAVVLGAGATECSTGAPHVAQNLGLCPDHPDRWRASPASRVAVPDPISSAPHLPQFAMR